MFDKWELIKSEIGKETRKLIAGRIVNQETDVIETLKNLLLFPLNNPAIRLEGLETRVINAMNKILIQGQTKADNHSFFLELAKIEPLFRKILYLTNPTVYTRLAQSRAGLNSFVKELGLNPTNIQLATAQSTAYAGDPNFLDQIIIVYKLRNIESHECAEWTSMELHSHIQSILCVYLWVIDKHFQPIHAKIDAYYAAAEKDFTAYLEGIRSSFEGKMRRFIHIKGKEDFQLSSPSIVELNTAEHRDQSRIERKGNILDLRNNEVPEKRMIIWGDAGMGKTTSLEYLTYTDAGLKLNHPDLPIPVFIALGLLTDKNVTIKQTIFNKLDIDVEYGEKLLLEGKINLCLDGVNEIPKDDNFSLRTLRHREIQNLLNTYESVFIILANRPQDINEFKTIPVFSLQKMDEEQIQQFVTKNTTEIPLIAEKIRKAIIEDDRLLKIIKSPLMLSRFIEIVRTAGDIPRSEGEIIHQFIHSLYRREKEEKKDASFDIKKIHRMLRYLGYQSLEKYGTNSGMSEDEVLNIFVKGKKEYGFEIDTVYVLDITTQLNILEKTDSLYTFAHQAYQDYFHSQQEKANIDL